ncbi:MAG TPA: isoprenylcysteine carboxylmethyltransferase family protein [Candidatus Nanoarchaeia archaeon]|nr:isoprenylcysteine carboxylmethyltransferase family protein [Candidatus Nanoarchaeia archaeon]
MDKTNLSITQQAVLGLAALAIIMWLAIFLPGWSINYWQGWIYWAAFFVSVTSISVYFIKRDLTLIANRLKAGPTAEKERSQQITQVFATVFFILLILIPPFDHHFRWSNVPLYAVIPSDALVVLGLAIVFLVFRENSFTSGIIEVNKDQRVISTGPYAVVRHPMYSGALLMLFFTPIALGSFWGLIAFLPMLIVIGYRLVEEEKFLTKKLEGYIEYCQRTRYRLVPFIW